MTERDSRSFHRVVRLLSTLTALALALWAFSDDSLIGGGPGFGSTQAVVLAVGLVLAASSFLSLAWNARALALVFSTGLVLLFAELVFQTLFSARYRSENELDTRALYRPISGAIHENKREAINGGETITYRINSQGFRGDELETDPAARIVVYGDSFTHGYYSANENTFVQRLDHDVSERLGIPVEVVNAGVAGYGPDQELRKMQRELGALKPDLVLVAVFTGNDFGDLVRNKLFRVREDGSVQENAFTITQSLIREMEVQKRESILKRVIRDGVQAMAVRVGLRSGPSTEVENMSPRKRLEYFLGQHVREYEEYVVQGDDVVRELAWDSYDADVSLTPRSDSARYKIKLMDGILGKMQEVTDEMGVPLVLIPIPHPVDLGGHATGEVDREKYPDYEPRGLVKILEEIATRRGIPHVDLYTPFAAHGSESIYFHGFDDHWNDAGQDLAAEVVADYLDSHGLLDSLASRRAQSAERNP